MTDMTNKVFRQGELGLQELALRQLAAWEAIAETWQLGVVWRDKRVHLVCAQDMTGIMQLTDSYRHGYRVTSSQIKAAVVAHLRNVHRELDPEAHNGR